MTDPTGVMNRRTFTKGAAALAGAAAFPGFALAGNPVERPLHGLSAFGELKYGLGFEAFDFASPDAPKGGVFAFSPSDWGYNQNAQTFNTLNTFVLKGEAPPRMELCFDKLMVRAWDEPDALYCALAESVTISSDRNRYRFALREAARFHDGTPVRAGDVRFSILALKEHGHPQIALDLVNLDAVEVLDELTVEMRFNGKQSDRVILSIAENSPIFNQLGFNGRRFDEATLDPLPGSGPWKVGKFQTGKFIEYEKVTDYWARNLPFARGIDHFDRIRIDFYQERTAAFEAFKKGEVHWREEFTSKVWATEYVFPSLIAGKVKQKLFDEEKRPSLQGWAANSRREKLANPLTRQGIATLFDFEWTNRNIFYDAYQRTHSIFERTDFAAIGKPSPDELALLEPFRSSLPDTVFDEAVNQNVTDGSGRDRSLFRKADALFKKAGWQKQGNALVDQQGRQLEIEFLINSQVFERVLGPYAENLRTMGINPSIRLVDASQFQARIESFDFDLVSLAFSFEANPSGEAMRKFFHSSNAEREGSHNYPGIKVPAVDAMLSAVEKAQTRAELVTALRALDRVLRAAHFWIPNWHAANHRVAYWDMFAWRDPKPDYAFPVERLWWQDAAKAARINEG
ncbi:MAG: extracellular solute-binding protein [Rhizobiaceae bacterium]